MKATFETGGCRATKETKRVDANFALIGRFASSPDYSVISIHKSAEFAKPSEVSNPDWHDIKVAGRVSPKEAKGE